MSRPSRHRTARSWIKILGETLRCDWVLEGFWKQSRQSFGCGVRETSHIQRTDLSNAMPLQLFDTKEIPWTAWAEISSACAEPREEGGRQLLDTQVHARHTGVSSGEKSSGVRCGESQKKNILRPRDQMKLLTEYVQRGAKLQRTRLEVLISNCC